MRILARCLRFCALWTIILTASSCCCCDPEFLGQFSEGMSDQFGEELQKKMEEEAAKMQAEAEKLAEAQNQAAQAEAPPSDPPPAAAEPVEAAPPTPAVAPPPPKPAVQGDRSGTFKDTKLDKKELTGGSLQLVVDDKTKKMTGRFLGQYYRKPFSIPVEGRISAKDDTFELQGGDGDSKIVVKGTHTGGELTGKVNGKVKGKAIDASFDAPRR